MEKNNIPEEVTITPVIRDLERLANKLTAFVISIFKGVGASLITFYFFCINNFLKLAIATAVGALLGFLSFYLVPRTYSSSMVLALNLDAKSQLHNDINYFDALIKREQFEQLASLLSISEEEASTLANIKLTPFSSEIEKIQTIDGFYKSLDTTTKRTLDFNKIYLDKVGELSKKYSIQVFATDERVFSKLESGFINYLERVSNLNSLREETKETLNYQKKLLMQQLNDLDTLKKVANQSMLKEAERESNTTSFMLGSRERVEGFNPLKIYDKYIDISNKILTTNQRLVALESIYTIEAHFNEFGSKHGFGKIKRALLFGLIFFFLAVVSIGLSSIKNPETK